MDGLYPWTRRPSYTSLIALEYLLYSLHPRTLHYAERPKFQATLIYVTRWPDHTPRTRPLIDGNKASLDSLQTAPNICSGTRQVVNERSFNPIYSGFAITLYLGRSSVPGRLHYRTTRKRDRPGAHRRLNQVSSKSTQSVKTDRLMAWPTFLLCGYKHAFFVRAICYTVCKYLTKFNHLDYLTASFTDQYVTEGTPVLQEYYTATVRGLQSRHAVSQYEFQYSVRTAIPDTLPNICSESGIRLFFGDESSQYERKSLT